MMSNERFPGFDHLYRVGSTGSNVVFHTTIDLSVKDGFAVVRGELKVDKPVPVRWVSGRRKPQDFVWTSIVAPTIVSDRVLTALKATNATGWFSYPVDLRGAENERIPGYHGVSIVDRCGPIQKERSRPVQKRYPGGIFTAKQGYFFDEQSWDGSGVFVPNDGSASVFVVEKVMQALTKAKLTGVVFKRVDLAVLP
jgi:hypothetical protein